MMNRDMSKGMHWIGHPGSLLPIIDAGEESMQADPQVALSTSLGGGVRARVSRKRAPRSWSLNVPNAHWDEVSHVQHLFAATLGPYQLVTARMQVSNVLTPERSVMTDQSSLGPGGSWPLAGGGWATTTRTNSGAVGGGAGIVYVGPCPIPPLWTYRPVTASVRIGTQRADGARMFLQWLDAAGSTISGVGGNTVPAGMDALRQCTVTASPPWGAVACRLNIQYAEVIAMPQVTWTNGPIEWSIGQGVDDVVITGMGDSTSMAVPDSRNFRRSSVGIELQEVDSA